MKRPRLSRRLVLEAPQRTPDGAGGFAIGWSALGALWAAVDAGAPRLVDGEAPERRTPLRITLRAAPPGAPSRPVPGQRLRDGSRLYAVEDVREADAAGRYLVVLAREEAAP